MQLNLKTVEKVKNCIGCYLFEVGECGIPSVRCNGVIWVEASDPRPEVEPE